jgi:hypothetical protein
LLDAAFAPPAGSGEDSLASASLGDAVAAGDVVGAAGVCGLAAVFAGVAAGSAAYTGFDTYNDAATTTANISTGKLRRLMIYST